MCNLPFSLIVLVLVIAVDEPVKASVKFALLLDFVHACEQTFPSNAFKSWVIYIVRPPNEYGFAHHMVFWHEAPVTRVGRVMPVVAHHPIVIHLKGVAVGGFIVDVNLSVSHLQLVVFVHAYGSFV